jgi:hypothetical protein
MGFMKLYHVGSGGTRDSTSGGCRKRFLSLQQLTTLNDADDFVALQTCYCIFLEDCF